MNLDDMAVFFKEPQIFLPVIALTLLILAAGAYLVYLTAIVLQDRIRFVQRLVETVEGLSRCRIGNWPEVRRSVPLEDRSGAGQALERIQEDSEDLYHGTWIPQPKEYLTAHSMIPRSQMWLFHRQIAALPISLGALASVLCFISAYLFRSSLVQEDRISLLALLCSPPLLGGLVVLLVWIAFSVTLWGHLMISVRNLNDAIGRKVPVYSDTTATAALVDSFLEYDRKMSASVQFLNESVESLASEKLSKAVSKSIEKMLEGTLVPAVLGMTATLSDLTRDIEQRQRDAMLQLAQSFARSLSEDMAKHLLPLTKQLDASATVLSGARTYFESTLDTFRAQRDLANSLLADTSAAQIKLEEARNAFLGEIHVSSAESVLRTEESRNAFLQDIQTRTTDSILRLAEERTALLADLQKQTADSLLKTEKTRTTLLADLEARSATAIEKLETVRAGFLTDIRGVSEDLGTLSAAAKSMAEVYSGNEHALSASVETMSSRMQEFGERIETMFGNSISQAQKTGEQAAASLVVNETHLQEMQKQITALSDELANRIDQVIIGFGSVTGDTLTGFKDVMADQNLAFSSNVKSLLETMEEEARSMSLYAKEIDMGIAELNRTLQSATSEFNTGMLEEVRGTLATFDEGLAEITKRLAVSTAEIGDAIEALPKAIRSVTGR